MDPEEILNLVPPEKQAEAEETLGKMKRQMIRGAISQVLARNQSHGVSQRLLNEQTQTKQVED